MPHPSITAIQAEAVLFAYWAWVAFIFLCVGASEYFGVRVAIRIDRRAARRDRNDRA